MPPRSDDPPGFDHGCPSRPRSSPRRSPVAHAPAAPTSAGPGLFGQMASTAAGVAVGSTVGHGLSSMLFGGGGSSTPAEAPAAPVEQQTYQQARMGGACEVQAKDFVSCLNATGNDTQSCQYYLDMLKQCQAAAAPY
uniref:FGENESH: predicted gene_16.135 protein n=1 Tax=Rhodotorula toruloides TaxID=5286 RepID=A0A0K3CQH2_RHOTO